MTNPVHRPLSPGTLAPTTSEDSEPMPFGDGRPADPADPAATGNTGDGPSHREAVRLGQRCDTHDVNYAQLRVEVGQQWVTLIVFTAAISVLIVMVVAGIVVHAYELHRLANLP